MINYQLSMTDSNSFWFDPLDKLVFNLKNLSTGKMDEGLKNRRKIF
jgi:hypothetical protein